jgi:hypothetical protein
MQLFGVKNGTMKCTNRGMLIIDSIYRINHCCSGEALEVDLRIAAAAELVSNSDASSSSEVGTKLTTDLQIVRKQYFKDLFVLPVLVAQVRYHN